MADRGRPRNAPFISDADDADRHRKQAAERSREKTKSSQEIGHLIHPVTNWERRLSCRLDLAKFLKTYLVKQFPLPFSRDHHLVIEKIQKAVLDSGLFACAMPRGSGKTEITKGAATWAIVYGHRKFPLLIGASGDAALELLDGVKYFLETRDDFPLLEEDFPEVVGPIIALEGEPLRQRGQRWNGERTKISWGKKSITLPMPPYGDWIDGKTLGPAPSAGATVRVTGIYGRIRGYNVKGQRPDLVLIDDPQKEVDARSITSRIKIAKTLGGAVPGVAGPGKKIAGLMTCTVIEHGDAISEILDHSKNPHWDSCRTKLLYSFPSDMALWQNYADTRNNYNPEEGANAKRQAADAATRFYADHRGAMQAGANVAWAERFSSDELDALQHAMNLFYDNQAGFYCEYQNDPKPPKSDSEGALKPADISGKLNNTPRGTIPPTATRLTAAIDVQKRVLYWVVTAWEENYTGYVIDYGAWPKQRLPYFTLAEVDHDIAKATGIQGLEGQIYAALTALTGDLLNKTWPQPGKGSLKIERCLIDAGYETDVVYQFARQSAHGAVVMPSQGRGIGAKKQPMAMWKTQTGDRRGLNWIQSVASGRALRHLIFDTNFYKSLLVQRWRTAMGMGGCMSLFGSDPREHRLFADHLTSEVPVTVSVEDTGRSVEEWVLAPNRDNHYLDCLNMNAVAANFQGVKLPGVHDGGPRKRVSFAKMYEEAQQRQAKGRAG